MKALFDRSERYMKSIDPLVKKVLSLQTKYSKMTNAELKEASESLREKIKEVKNKEQVICEAFAICREASKRVLGKEHFPCQIQAGFVLLDNKIAEMATGEGKTLAGILPAYFKALEGTGVHIITSNDYLAERDYQEMGKVFEFLGLTTGLVQSNTSTEERRNAYKADITYCSSSQVCFDYLRDNLALNNKDCVLGKTGFALIDEADSLLIDEAETSVRIAGQLPSKGSSYVEAINLIKDLKGITATDEEYNQSLEQEYDFIINPKTGSIEMTELLYSKLNTYRDFDQYDQYGRNIAFYVQNALIAEYTKKKDKDYVVNETENGIKIELVDQNTGRIAYRRQYGDGLHLAIQVKEILLAINKYRKELNEAIKNNEPSEKINELRKKIKKISKMDNQNYDRASITFRNYLKLYDSVSGMTGTAMDAREELVTLYGLDVIKVPRNKPLAAQELPERIFITKHDKYIAIAKEILKAHSIGRPVLVGTNSIEESERIASYLEKINQSEKLSYEILNARPENSKREAEIVAKAGQKGAITIATNMAGRGTDIKVNEEVKKLGGLLVIGCERNISKRIDNQLKGRTGRQGDPGSIQFFSSLEDEIVRSFSTEKFKSSFEGAKELSSKILTKGLDFIQRKRESLSFRRRKAINEIDDIIQNIRSVYYKERKQLLDDSTLQQNLLNMITRAIMSNIKESLDSKGEKIDSIDQRIRDRFLDLSISLEDNVELAIQNIKENVANRIKNMSERELANLRSIFLRNSDMEFSILCKTMEQHMESPIYWFSSLEESRTKRIIDSYERYTEFCNFILDCLLEDILNKPISTPQDNKTISKK